MYQIEWDLLKEKLAAHAQTGEGRDLCVSIEPELDRDEIESRWNQVFPLKELVRSSYRPPIGELPVMASCFRAAELGQIFDGETLRDVASLLRTTRNVQQFAKDFEDKCVSLHKYAGGLYPLPKLLSAIERAIGDGGEIVDDASPELKRIRVQKLSVRKEIEKTIRRLLSDRDLEMFLQDKFFTIRAERYVVPIRIDGRGKVKGSIYDTSDSGQTLYIEPTEITSANEKLLELELSEKLEVIRIFRDLSAMVAEERDNLQADYELMVELDFLTAQASLAHQMAAGRVELSPEPCLDLRAARHPLVKSPAGDDAVANDIFLEPDQTCLIVSGPNAGGKTVVLKTVGILHLMVKSGLLIPADPSSRMFLFRRMFIEMGDNQSLTANLSTFSAHLQGLKPIVEQADPEDIVLFDELAVGTEPQTGCAIAQAILEYLGKRKVHTLVTTHFDGLKGLPMASKGFRNGSMEFSAKSLKPTYQLILDVPGQSYGLEVAEQMGFPAAIISRASELKGVTGTTLDRVIAEFMEAREALQEKTRILAERQREQETQKSHWEAERRSLEEAKREAVRRVSEDYEGRFERLVSEYDVALNELKGLLKKARKHGEDPTQMAEELQNLKERAVHSEGEVADLISEINKASAPEIPGRPCTEVDLAPGMRVYLISLGKEAVISKYTAGDNPVIEVKAGMLTLRPSLQEMRVLDDEEAPIKQVAVKSNQKKPNERKPEQSSLVLQTPTNTLDIRGFEKEPALEQVWQFIDKAFLRGESQLVIVHGHGTDTLKRALRRVLSEDCPYQLTHRPGGNEEGGDGVTIIFLN